MTLHPVAAVIAHFDKEGVDVPIEVRLRAHSLGAVKAADDLSSINAQYNRDIVDALTQFFEGGSVSSPKNAFKRSAVDNMGAAFDLGWTDGGGELPEDSDTLSLFNARVDQEMSNIDMLFENAKGLRQETDLDYFSWITDRADGYTNTLRELYNLGKLNAMKDQMVTFEGDDGKESCPDCQKLKGQRHRISWFVNRDFVPPFGDGLQCAAGGQCQHGLMNDAGEWVTV